MSVKEIDLENEAIKIFIDREKYADETEQLDFSFWDTRPGNGGFQTMLTKKDAKAILKVLDNWISNKEL